MAVGCVRQMAKVTAHTHTHTHTPTPGHISNEIKAIMRQQSARIAVIQVNKHTPHYLPLSVYHTLVVVDTFHSLSLYLSLSPSLSLCLRRFRFNKIRNAIKENNVPAIAFGFAFISADTINTHTHI